MSDALLLGSPYQTERYRLMREELAQHGIDATVLVDGAPPPRAALAAAQVIVLDRHHKADRAMIAAAPRLRGIVSPIAGTDHIDIGAATEAGLIVGRGQTPENTIGMAEATVALLLACLYDIPSHARIVQTGEARPVWPLSRLASGKTLGLIGFGKIARGVCARLAGWNVQILVYSRYPAGDLPPHVRQVDLDEVYLSSDVISLHTTLSDSTRKMIDAEAIARMKRGVILINTARAALIDEQALASAVRDGQVSRVALDAIDPLPVPSDSPLRDMPGALLTPHMLGHSQEGALNFVRTGVESVRRILAGEAPPYVCNPDIVAAWRALWSVPS
ncbi:MAG: serA 4 [Hyphomicrobiales bacterium]|nr:serA 4 [Hyphomicrobiales bacterium]